MSEDLQLDDHNGSSATSEVEEALDMQRLLKTEIAVNPNSSLYPPERIGLKADTGGYTVNIVGEIGLEVEGMSGSGQPSNARAALLRVTKKASGEVRHALMGLRTDADGVTRKGDVGYVEVRLEEDGITIGRNADSASKDKLKKNPALVPAERIWGPGVRLTERMSREHLTITDKAGVLHLHDTSTNGTMVRAEAELVEPAAEDVASESGVPASVEVPTVVNESELEVVSPQALSDQDGVGDNSAYEGTAMSEAQEKTPRETAMQELRDAWGLGPDETFEKAVSRLRNTKEMIQRVLAISNPGGDLVRDVQDVVSGLRDSLEGRGTVYLNFDKVKILTERLQTLEVQANALRNEAMMPEAVRNQLDASANTLMYARGSLGDTMPQANMMNIDNAQTAQSFLGQQPVEQIQVAAALLQSAVDQKLIELTGVDEAVIEDAIKKFANERIARLAGELSKEDVSKADVERAVVAMERYLDEAIADTTSGVTYPSRIIDNDQAPRRGGEYGREKGSSRRIAAEMAVDMLRGAFDTANASGEIMLTADGRGVELGQHRAAALMTLYGRNWIEAGKATGHKIVPKRR